MRPSKSKTISFTPKRSRLSRSRGVGHARRLPGDHPPRLAGSRVDRQVADGEALRLAVALHVHLRHAVDDADAAVHTHAALAGRDAAIVRLAGLHVRHV